MYCPKCGKNGTRVKDIAHSHHTYLPGKGHEYLQRWGKNALGGYERAYVNARILECKGRLGTEAHFTARILECTFCSYKFRTMELIVPSGLSPTNETEEAGMPLPDSGGRTDTIAT
mgnify:CR=1 FL=1